MIQLQGHKIVQIIAPQAVKDNTEFVGSKGSTPVSVDTRGFRYMEVIAQFGAMDIAMVTMKLWESDDDSTYTAVTGGDFSTGSHLPSATDDNHSFRWRVDLTKNHKRYFQVEMVPGDGSVGTYAIALAILTRAEQYPSSASGAGYTYQLDC